MKISIRKLFIYILLILTIMILFTASLTLARYSDEYESSGTYPGDIEYVVSDQVEIKSVEEFFAAIENGYSNVIIADEVDNPIIISGGISDVHSDLVIDLNGHTIQRNNREPLLNVTQGVRLTIIDSSEEQDGSFYNPVGSVLRISGGTLTVAAGEFESGPRNGKGDVAKSEYYGSVTTGNAVTAYGAHFSGVEDVTLKTSENASSGTPSTMPIIIPGVQQEGNSSRSVNGNIYLDTEYVYDKLSSPTRSFSADTYLYFTLDDETVENSTIAASGSANYLYSYYLNNDLTQYVGATAATETDILVTIYVYEDVKATADPSIYTGADKSTFSAIDMSSGNLYVRGGKYFSYFGVDNTYCVNATGGYMSIEKGDFNAYGKSVCVQCAYDGQSNVETEYLHVTDGTFFSEIGDTIGVSGGRMIVSKATFEKDAIAYSIDDLENKRNANGSAINVTGGTLTVSADSSSSLIKFSLYGSGMSGITASSEAQVSVKNVEMDFYSGKTENGNQSQADGISYNTGIFAEGGTVLCDGNTTFKVIGEYSSGIYANNGKININGSSFTCKVDMGSSTELSSTAISSVGGNIAFNVQTATITSNGLGITVGGGDISFGHTNAETISITTTRGTAIYAYGGALTIDAKSTLNVTSAIASGCKWAIDTSSGSSGGTDTGVNINNGIYIDGGTFTSQGEIDITHTGIANNTSTSGIVDSKILSYAVRVDGSDSTSAFFNAVNLKIETTQDGGGLYVNDGLIELGSAEITSVGYGIALRGGSGDTVTVKDTLDVTTTKATAIYITGGSLTLEGVTTVISAIDSDYIKTLGTSGTPSYDGVFIEGGSLTASSTFNVTHEGVENDGQLNNNGSTLYKTFKIKSYAVRVAEKDGKTPKVIIKSGSIVNSVGGGVYVSGGNVTLGDEQQSSGSSSVLTVSTTGTEVQGDYISPETGAASNWRYKQSLTGGHAVEVNGGTLAIYSGSYSAAQGEGILVRSGTANVYYGTFVGNDKYQADGGGRLAGPAASYCFKLYGGVANIYGGTFVNGDSTQGSGAFVSGNSADDMGKANIYGGKFDVNGQAGFSIFDYANVLFAPRGRQNGAGGDITVAAYTCAIAVENRGAPVNIEIRGGTFNSKAPSTPSTASGGYDAIWYSNYNQNSELKISGGTFTANVRNGIFFAERPYNVEISGGTFYKGIGGSFTESSILATGYKFNKSSNTWTVVKA